MNILYKMMLPTFSLIWFTGTLFAASSTDAVATQEHICVSQDINSKNYICRPNTAYKPADNAKDKKKDTKKKAYKKPRKVIPQYALTTVDRKAIKHLSDYVRKELFIEPYIHPSYAKNVGVLVCANYMNLKKSFDKKSHILNFAKKISPLSSKEFFEFIRVDNNLSPTDKGVFLFFTYLSTAIAEPNINIAKQERAKGCF